MFSRSPRGGQQSWLKLKRKPAQRPMTTGGETPGQSRTNQTSVIDPNRVQTACLAWYRHFSLFRSED